MNADALVMDEDAVLSRAEICELDWFEERWCAAGFAFAAAERKSDGAFVGMVASSVSIRSTVLSLRRDRVATAAGTKGPGYANEAAQAWLAYHFDKLALPEVVAFTDHGNARSLAVMRRLGMLRDQERDFVYPEFPEGDPRCPLLCALGNVGRRRCLPIAARLAMVDCG